MKLALAWYCLNGCLSFELSRIVSVDCKVSWIVYLQDYIKCITLFWVNSRGEDISRRDLEKEGHSLFDYTTNLACDIKILTDNQKISNYKSVCLFQLLF